MYPSDHLLGPSSIAAPKMGQDCTAIPNINEVACHRGACEIKSCQRGYQLAQNGTACEGKARLASGSGSANIYDLSQGQGQGQGQARHGLVIHQTRGRTTHA